MNILYKFGYRKHYIVAYSLSILAIVFYALLYFFEGLHDLLILKTTVIFNSIPYLDLKLFLYVLGFTIIGVVFLIFSLIKCPKCGYRFFWHWFNDSRRHKGKGNPIEISACPNCGYDEEQ